MDAVLLLGAYAEAKNRHDVAEMLARTHPECRYTEVGNGVELVGHAALRHQHEDLFAAVPDYAFTQEGIAGTGDGAVAWGRFHGTLAGPLRGRGRSGDTVDTAAVFVCTFRDGLLFRESAHIDLVSLRKQLAAAPQRFVDAFTAAWAQPAAAALSALFTEDATLQHPGMPEPVRGRAAIHAYFAEVLAASPDLTLRPTATATRRDSVFVHWQISAAGASWDGIDRFRLRGELAEHGVAHFDPSTIRPMRSAS